MKKRELLLITLFTVLALSACGKKVENSQVLYTDYKVYDVNTHLDKYETITVETTPNIIIDDSVMNWVESEDNGVEALTHYEVMKDMLSATNIHNEENYTNIEILSNTLARDIIEVLGDYGNKYSASALYEKALEAKAEYVDIIDFSDMGDGTYELLIDFGNSQHNLYISDTESFIN